MLKECKGCFRKLQVSCFGKHAQGAGGLRSQCRDCRATEAKERNARPEVQAKTRESKKAWRSLNGGKHAAYNREWNLSNPGRAGATCLKWRGANPDKVKAYSAEYGPAHQAARTANQNKRHTDKLHRTPKWANFRKIKSWYIAAAARGLQVDHIIPLRGALVSGLHVHTNLQLLSAHDNQSKHNRYEIC